MTDAMQVKEALLRELHITSDADYRSWTDIERAFRAIAAAPSPAALDPVTVETCASLADRLKECDPDALKNYGKAIRALIGQTAPTGNAPKPVAGPMEFNKPEPTDKDEETLAEMRDQLWAAGFSLEDAEFIAKMLWGNGFDITKRAAPASNPQEAK